MENKAFEVYMIIEDRFSGWMRVYRSGLTYIEVRQVDGVPAHVTRQFPKPEHAEQWLDEFPLWDKGQK